MDTISAVKNRILQLCGERNISVNRLASISALPPSSVKNILYGKSQNPKLLTIKMLCDGLGITLGEFSPRRSSMRWSRRSGKGRFPPICGIWKTVHFEMAFFYIRPLI